MYGCEWDDDTGATGGFNQFGYDGEDFITYDLKNQRYIGPTPQASITAQKWNNDPAQLEHRKQYLTQECVAWLQKYVSYRRSALERTVAPKVSLLQKDSLLSCRYLSCDRILPRGIMVTWQKDGKDLDEDVELGRRCPTGRNIPDQISPES
ncbi:hypothetical protein ANANG_G00184100 [Anguilla anguilla]|uniref:MHC class I-like antigen recognition-like domain-containing protein n=1 Tax=Anguilla anguilla TaxID=7936 RepID=A0A9D3M734_ANGAN|nr:hypothetical protein ANANG_G00184100 [Anguilla anguilla]